MAEKHTPGPWTNDPLQPTIWANDGETKIATIADLPWKERGSDWMTEQANAQLIAAAPCQHSELLAVEKLLAAYVAHQPIEMCAFAERLESVRVVIAKGGNYAR